MEGVLNRPGIEGSNEDCVDITDIMKDLDNCEDDSLNKRNYDVNEGDDVIALVLAHKAFLGSPGRRQFKYDKVSFVLL